MYLINALYCQRPVFSLRVRRVLNTKGCLVSIPSLLFDVSSITPYLISRNTRSCQKCRERGKAVADGKRGKRRALNHDCIVFFLRFLSWYTYLVHKYYFTIKTDNALFLLFLSFILRAYIQVNVSLPSIHFRRLPRELQEGRLVKVIPVLFTQGINEHATLAERCCVASYPHCLNYP